MGFLAEYIMKISENKINEFYAEFISELESVGVDTEKLVKFIGEDKIKKAPAGLEVKSGLACPGALLFLMINSLKYAKKLYNATSSQKVVQTLSGEEEKTVNELGVNYESLVKVTLLHHIGKTMIYEPNDDEWQVNKRGILYKWVDNETTINCGERAQYICQRCGIEFSETEFEAMKINDKNNEDKFSMLHIQPLSMMVKQADELTYMRINLANKKK